MLEFLGSDISIEKTRFVGNNLYFTDEKEEELHIYFVTCTFEYDTVS